MEYEEKISEIFSKETAELILGALALVVREMKASDGHTMFTKPLLRHMGEPEAEIPGLEAKAAF